MPTAYLLVSPRRGLRGPPVLSAIKTVLNLPRRPVPRYRRARNGTVAPEHRAGEESTGGPPSRYSGMYEWKRTYRGLIVTNLRDRDEYRDRKPRRTNNNESGARKQRHRVTGAPNRPRELPGRNGIFMAIVWDLASSNCNAICSVNGRNF